MDQRPTGTASWLPTHNQISRTACHRWKSKWVILHKLAILHPCGNNKKKKKKKLNFNVIFVTKSNRRWGIGVCSSPLFGVFHLTLIKNRIYIKAVSYSYCFCVRRYISKTFYNGLACCKVIFQSHFTNNGHYYLCEAVCFLAILTTFSWQNGISKVFSKVDKWQACGKWFSYFLLWVGGGTFSTTKHLYLFTFLNTDGMKLIF